MRIYGEIAGHDASAEILARLLGAGEKEEAHRLAGELLASGRAPRELAEKICSLCIGEGDAEGAAAAADLFSEEEPVGKYLHAHVRFLQGRLEEAERACRELAMRGGLPYPLVGSEHRLLADIHGARGDMAEAAEERRLAAYASGRVPWEYRMAQYSAYLMLLHYTPQARGFIYRQACLCQKYLMHVRPFSRWEGRGKKLRIGYLSPDFRAHVVANFSQAFFLAADRERFEVYGYATCKEDAVTRRMARGADVWRNVSGHSPEEIAGCIHEDGIDILVELAGHTGGNCLPVLAYRPAPVQVCGIGYFSTTGLSCVDYFLVDRYTAAPGEESFFTETLLRLPETHLCYTPVKELPEPAGIPPCTEKGVITFGSLNNIDKVSDATVNTWGDILGAVPGSRLYLKAAGLDDPARRARELTRLGKVGIGADRILMEGFTREYAMAYEKMDIALDTFPYPGGGTTCDALYMGVPVISLAGASNHERFGFSLLANLGLGELCGRTRQEYVARALRLARDPERLRELHGTLRSRMEGSPVMDQGRYMKGLERAYEEIWRRYEKERRG